MNSVQTRRIHSAAIQNVGGRELHALTPEKVIAIGASNHADIRLKDGPADQIEAVIFWDSRGWMLVDCVSGRTRVNDEPVQQRSLHAGDILSFGGGEAWIFSEKACGPAKLRETYQTQAIPSIVIEASHEVHYGPILGQGASTARLRDDVHRLAGSSSNILIVGECGVGKCHVARALHGCGPRRSRRLVTVNCLTVTASDLRNGLASLFDPHHLGADGTLPGTIVLEDIEFLSPECQEAMLELLTDISERRRRSELGEVPPRFIALATKDRQERAPTTPEQLQLESMLSVVQLLIDPLRTRREDIPELADKFYQRCSAAFRQNGTQLPPEAISGLMEYDWPGNVAELRIVVERAVLLHQAREGKEVPLAFQIPVGTESAFSGMSLEEMERRHIEDTLRALNWTKSRAARVLGIERSTLDRKITRYGLRRPTLTD